MHSLPLFARVLLSLALTLSPMPVHEGHTWFQVGVLSPCMYSVRQVLPLVVRMTKGSESPSGHGSSSATLPFLIVTRSVPADVGLGLKLMALGLM